MKRYIGSSGLSVFAIGLGAMPLGIRKDVSDDDAVEVIHAAIDAGINFIDTANVYCQDDSDVGVNERRIAKALETVDKDGVVVGTKGGLARPQGRWERRGTPQNLRSACEQSLRDLKVDCITLYQLHAPDPLVPFAESVGELSRLRVEGKIQHIGLSNVGRVKLDEALSITPIVSVQNRCGVFNRQYLENGFVDHCKQQNITFIAYSPLGGGNRYLEIGTQPILSEIARRHGATAYQVALAWLLAKGENILPIPGAGRISSALSSAHAISISLSEDEVARIDTINDT